MNSKNSLLKLGMATLAFCLLLTAFLTGCGGSNSSGGTSATTGDSTAISSYTIRGKLLSDVTNQTPAAGVLIKLLIQDAATSKFNETGKETTTLTSGEFSFTGLQKGVYVLSAIGNANFQNSQMLVTINESNTEADVEVGNMSIMTVGSTPTGEVTLIGKTVADGPSATPISNLTVTLSVLETDGNWKLLTEKVSTTITSGDFVFLKLESGTYKVDINGYINGVQKYSPASKLAIISSSNSLTQLDIGNIIMTSVPSQSVTIPTLNLKARVMDVLASAPLSVAIVSMDSGQSAVTDGLGIFEIKNLEVGTRKLTVTQQGMASFTISFEVKGTSTTATSITIDGQDFAINSADGKTVNLFSYGYDLKVTLSPHVSGSLMGTVKRFKIENGVVTYITEPWPNYPFDLWVLFPDNTSKRFGSVRSDENGEWKIDNLPPFEDNNALWQAVPTGTTVKVEQGQTGMVSVYTNTASVWNGREPILATGYKVQSGQTTIMDFTVPSFVYDPYKSTLTPPADAGFATLTTAIFPNDYTVQRVDTIQNVYFKWTGPTGVDGITLEFTRAYKAAETPSLQKFFKSSPGAVNNQVFIPSTIGLDLGRYAWRTIIYDPNSPSIAIYADAKMLSVVPSSKDLMPEEGTPVQRYVATYTVTFMAPVDDEATSISMELYRVDPTGPVLIANPKAADISTNAIWEIEFPKTDPASPVAGNYKWRAIYFYSDSAPMTSEYANITFK